MFKKNLEEKNILAVPEELATPFILKLTFRLEIKKNPVASTNLFVIKKMPKKIPSAVPFSSNSNCRFFIFFNEFYLIKLHDLEKYPLKSIFLSKFTKTINIFY